MKTYSHLTMGLTAGAFLLIGMPAIAQRPSTGSTSTKAAAATNVQSRETASGHASGLAADHPGTGQNPLFESKDKADLKPGTGDSNVQPNKDPEDTTARYRPGKNKPVLNSNKRNAAATETAPPREAASGHASGRQDQFGHASGIATDSSGSSGQTEAESRNSAHATETMQKKHIAGVKYEDRTAIQSQDAQNGQGSANGTQKNGLKAAGTEQTNKMAIKEDGLRKHPAK